MGSILYRTEHELYLNSDRGFDTGNTRNDCENWS